MSSAVVNHPRATWTNITRPTAQDMHELSVRYPRFHQLNLQDCLDEMEYPRLDRYDDHLFLVVQMPVWNDEDRSYSPAEVDIFIYHGNLVTAHQGGLERLNELFTQSKNDEQARDQLMGRGASPLLHTILDALVNEGFEMVKETGARLRGLEKRMFGNNLRPLLREVAEVRRNIIILRRIYNTQREVIEGLYRGKWDFIQDSLDPYWNDINSHLTQLTYMLDQYGEVISGLSETIDTLASHKIDEVVRLLTVVTVVTMPVTLLGAIFGMNLEYRFREPSVVFVIVLLAGFGLSALVLWFLHRKKWL